MGNSLYLHDPGSGSSFLNLEARGVTDEIREDCVLGCGHLGPLYFMFDLIGRNDPAPITHPGFFYGFVGVALVWQIAFIFIAMGPVRYRPLMIPSVLEKVSYGTAVITLVLQGRMHKSDLIFAGTDLLLGVLFVIA